METFVILREAPRIRKIVTQGDLQHELQDMAEAQMAEFMEHEEAFDFDGQYKPDHNEVLKIDGFDDVLGLFDATKNPDDCLEWTPSKEDLAEVKGFFFAMEVDGITHIGIQNFDKRQVISNKTSMFWSKHSFERVGGIALSFDNKLCAVLKEDGDTSVLMFKSLHNVRRIFDMDAYYNEATIAEINSFFGHEVFTGYDQQWLEAHNDNWIRKTVTYISKEGILDNSSPEQISAVAQSIGFDIKTTVVDGKEKIVFPQEKKELKRLLTFLDEDMYLSPITNTLYVTNSKRRFKK